MGANSSLADEFLCTLQTLPERAKVFNPWVDAEPSCEEDADAPKTRSSNLARYLRERIGTARVALVAEAPSYRGAKFSGIAMTSERIALGRGRGVLKQFHLAEFCRTSDRDRWPLGLAEQTATLVWSRLIELGYPPTEFVLWNAYPCHPHDDGNRFSNRKPTRGELLSAAHVLQHFLSLFAGAQVVAVGKVAQDALREMKVDLPYVRHPANGGAAEFQCALHQRVASRDPSRPAT